MTPFSITEMLNGNKFLRIESARLVESIDFYNANKASIFGVSLSDRLYKLQNLNFLLELKGVKGVILVDEVKDISALLCARDLEYIQIEKITDDIDLSVFGRLQHLRCEWSKRLKNISLASNLDSLALWGYKSVSENLEELTLPKDLKSLELVKSPISSLAGLERNMHLNSVSLHYLSKLEDISALSSIAGLREIHFEKCKKIITYKPLSRCQSLARLNIEDCAPIQDLSFVKSMPALEELFFVGTKLVTKFSPASLSASLKKVVGTSGSPLKLL